MRLPSNRMTRRDAWKISTDGTEGERHAERWVGSARRECLDRMLIVSQRHLDEVHLEAVRGKYCAHYNDERPHRSCGLRPPASPASEFDGLAALLEDT